MHAYGRCVIYVDRLWEDGWKDRYYSSKFGVDGSDQEFRRTVVNLLCMLISMYMYMYLLMIFITVILSDET